MDPDTALARLRAEVESHLAHGDGDPDVLAQGIRDLDEWLTGGGFKPTDWACHDTLAEAVGPQLAVLLAPPSPGRDAHVAAIQRELDAHPTWTTPSETTDELARRTS